MLLRPFILIVASLAACGGGSDLPTTAALPPAPDPGAPAPSPAAGEPAPTAATPSTEASTTLVRFTIGARAYEARLGDSATLMQCADTATPCVATSVRSGDDLREAWRQTLARMVERARTEPCADETAGDAVHLEIDGVARDFVLVPLPESVDYLPPPGDTYRECAARELTRTVMTYLAWE